MVLSNVQVLLFNKQIQTFKTFIIVQVKSNMDPKTCLLILLHIQINRVKCQGKIIFSFPTAKK